MKQGMDPRNIIIGVLASILVMVVLGLSIPLLNDAATTTHLSNRISLLEYALGAAGINAGEVLYSSDGDSLDGDSDFTFDGTDTLTVTGLNAPTGRSSTYVIASVNATSAQKAQADHICDGSGDVTEINSYITLVNASGSHGNIQLYGSFSGTTELTPLTDCDISGPATIEVKGTSDEHGMYVNDVSSCTIENVDILRTGHDDASIVVGAYITGNSTERSFILRDLTITNNATCTQGFEYGSGVFIGQYCTPSPTLVRVKSYSNWGGANNYGYDIRLLYGIGDTTGDLGSPLFIDCEGYSNAGDGGGGWGCSEAQDTILINCRGYGGEGDNTFGIGFWDCSPTLIGCTGVAGNGANGAGFTFWGAGVPYVRDCEGIIGGGDNLSGWQAALQLKDNTSAIIDNFYGHSETTGHQFNYVSDDNGRFLPFDDVSYEIISAAVWVGTGPTPGDTLDIGTTPGGDEVASNIDIGTIDQIDVTVTPQTIAAGGYLYATPSDTPTSTVQIYYTVQKTSNANLYGILFGTEGNCVIKNSTFTSPDTDDGYELCIRIQDEADDSDTPNWLIENCYIKTYGTYAIWADSLIDNAPIYNCTIIGTSDPHNVLFDGSNRTSTGGQPGEWKTISKGIDHASLTDNEDATAYMDFEVTLPAYSMVKAVRCDFTEAFNSDDTSTLTMMIGYSGDLDAFCDTSDPGFDAFNHTTDRYWWEEACQSANTTASKTIRVTFTEDDDGTDIISSANAQGTVIVSVTYIKG